MAEHYSTYSQIALHRSCPQKFNYRHIRRLEPIYGEDSPVEKDFGSWWHALRAADSIERGAQKRSLKQVPKKLKTSDDGPTFPVPPIEEVFALAESGALDLVGEVMRGAESWHATLNNFEKDAWTDRLGGPLPERLAYINARYSERWAEEQRYEEPLAVEMFWRRLLPSLQSDDGEKFDLDTAMIGFVDEVYYDRRRNLVVARDHKTHKSLGTQSAAEDMMDSQLQIYTWGASPEITKWGLGPVKATAFDRVRTAPPKQPKVTQAGTLSKSVSDYDLATYLSFAAGPDGLGAPYPGRKKDGSEAGFYHAEQTVIDKLSDPAALSGWFQRTLQPLNRNIITTHLRAAVDTSLDIQTTRKRAEETGEAARNFGKPCNWCDFAALCRAEMTGGSDGDYDLASMNLRVRAPRNSRS